VVLHLRGRQFCGNQAWALELCEAMKPLKVSWASQCDILISKSDKLLRAMRGQRLPGADPRPRESAAADAAEAGKKFVQSDTYAARIRKIQSFSISLWGAFIFGFDNDTWRDCMAAVPVRAADGPGDELLPDPDAVSGDEFFRPVEREGRIKTYRLGAVQRCERRLRAAADAEAELRHAQMAAFAEFFSLRSAAARLKLWPVKSRAWVANVACWKGIQYYYARKRRRVPAFRDFVNGQWREEGTEARRHDGGGSDGGAGANAGAPGQRGAITGYRARSSTGRQS
jgi:hypothetical protein